jgi:hypothetical protein
MVATTRYMLLRRLVVSQVDTGVVVVHYCCVLSGNTSLGMRWCWLHEAHWCHPVMTVVHVDQ